MWSLSGTKCSLGRQRVVPALAPFVPTLFQGTRNASDESTHSFTGGQDSSHLTLLIGPTPIRGDHAAICLRANSMGVDSLPSLGPFVLRDTWKPKTKKYPLGIPIESACAFTGLCRGPGRGSSLHDRGNTIVSDLFSRLERKLATSRERPRLSAKGPRGKLLYANKADQRAFKIAYFLFETSSQVAFVTYKL